MNEKRSGKQKMSPQNNWFCQFFYYHPFIMMTISSNYINKIEGKIGKKSEVNATKKPKGILKSSNAIGFQGPSVHLQFIIGLIRSDCDPSNVTVHLSIQFIFRITFLVILSIYISFNFAFVAITYCVELNA